MELTSPARSLITPLFLYVLVGSQLAGDGVINGRSWPTWPGLGMLRRTAVALARERRARNRVGRVMRIMAGIPVSVLRFEEASLQGKQRTSRASRPNIREGEGLQHKRCAMNDSPDPLLYSRAVGGLLLPIESSMSPPSTRANKLKPLKTRNLCLALFDLDELPYLTEHGKVR